MRLTSDAGHLIRRSQQVHETLWTKLVVGGLTSPQYAVLATLAAFPDLDQKGVGRLASLDKSSAADVIARLVRKAWVMRERDPLDGRRRVLSLTPAAAVALHSITPQAAEVQERLLAPLPAQRRRTLVEQLAAVARFDDALSHREAPHHAALDLRVPGHLIRRAQQIHTELWADNVGTVLTGPQYAALYVVSRWPGINQRQLGELAALDKSTTADLVARLLRRGLLRRHQDPVDARSQVLEVTESARSTLTEVDPKVGTVQGALLEPLSASACQAFLRDLRRVAIPERG
jgi:DNA-binding MarR family transcriptional regulator